MTEPEPPVNLARRRLLRDIDRTARAMLEPPEPRPAYVVHPADAPALRAFLTGRPQLAYEPPPVTGTGGATTGGDDEVGHSPP